MVTNEEGDQGNRTGKQGIKSCFPKEISYNKLLGVKLNV